MKHVVAAVALGAAGALAQSWDSWDPTTTTTSAGWGGDSWSPKKGSGSTPVGPATTTSAKSCNWGTISGVTTVATSTVCPSYTSTGLPTWFSELPSSVVSSLEAHFTGPPPDWCLYTPVGPATTTSTASAAAATTTWGEWSADPTTNAAAASTNWAEWSDDPSMCAATSTVTVLAGPTGQWGAFPSTLTETDTVTVWVMPSGGYSTAWPAGASSAAAPASSAAASGWGADPGWSSESAAAPASSWDGSWPAEPVTSVIASNAASWVFTAPTPTGTAWMPNGPNGLQCGNASTGLQEPGCNTAADRSGWCGGYDINTDFYENCPNTGKVVSYSWQITNGTNNFDGEERPAFLINGQTPGPLVEANWGDTIEITVTNNLQDNGTEIHWHGLWQRGTNDQDGVPGVTACALAPGQTRTYKFQACQYGSSWYHSHWLTQYGDGLQGPIVIHGPASANYDIDMGPVLISDLFYITAAQAYDWISHQGPGGSKNYLLNGKNTDANNTNGEHALWQLQPGKKHLFRLVNTAAQNLFSVHFDGHEMEVIATDFVPIQPYTTDWINIGIGQRYDVIVTANQPSGNYFLRAVTQLACPATCDNNGFGSSNGILQYADAQLALPQSDTGGKTPGDFGICADEPLASLVPWVSKSAGSSDAFAAQASTLPAGNVVATETDNDGLMFRWFINNNFMDVDYTSPTLMNIAQNTANNESVSNAIFLTGSAGSWVYLVIQNQFFAGHPMHLHGHDFYILGAQSGDSSPAGPNGGAPTLFSASDVATLNFDNPPRRDTALLADNGWTAIGFIQDNPGTWLLHCHIVWHIDGGLGIQFVEQQESIPNYYTSAFQEECSAYAAYEAENPAHQKNDGESGLRRRWMDKLMSTTQNNVVRRGNTQKQYLESHLKRGVGDSHRRRHGAHRR